MKKNISSKEQEMVVREEMTCYQRRINESGITRIMMQQTLNEECITLIESKEQVLEKVKNHFRNL
jgi:hypothetical protein